MFRRFKKRHYQDFINKTLYYLASVASVLLSTGFGNAPRHPEVQRVNITQGQVLIKGYDIDTPFIQDKIERIRT